MARHRWIDETILEPLGVRASYRAERVLHETRTGHQHLVLFKHKYLGKMLMLDGAVQISSRDEFIYQEMMAHVPLFAHGRARDVLIVGGGDCGIAKEVLKHKSVRHVTLVEIDASVIDFAKKHYPKFARPVFADRRFQCVIEDGARFVARTDRRFDVIIVDSTDPQGPGLALFTRKFYAGCRRCLAKGGVLVTQNGVPFFQGKELATSLRRLRGLFTDVTCYTAAVPTYFGGLLAMGFATDDRRLRVATASMIAARYRKAGSIATRYWTPAVHTAAFALPRFIAGLAGKPKQP